MSFNLIRILRKALPALRKPSYTASHSAVLMSIADHFNDNDGYAFPGMELIAAECFIGKRQARKVVSQLEADGLLDVIRFPRRSSHYKLHINGPVLSDKGHNNGMSEGGVGAVEKVAEARPTVADARLTYTSNHLFKSGEAFPFNFLLESATLAQELLTEPRSTGQSPAKPSELDAPCKAVQDLHALLMKKIGSKNPEPSRVDTELLQAAIETYGISELYLLVEWVFKQKNNFWRERLKKAGRPCSFLATSLPTIRRQFEEKEEERQRSAIQRNLNRSAKEAASVVHGSPADDFEEDISAFTLTDEELDD